MFAEVVLGLFELLCVEQQEVSEAAVGELVDNRATEELGQKVVDVGPDEGAHAGSDDNQGDIQAGTRLQSLVGCWRNHQF